MTQENSGFLVALVLALTAVSAWLSSPAVAAALR